MISQSNYEKKEWIVTVTKCPWKKDCIGNAIGYNFCEVHRLAKEAIYAINDYELHQDPKRIKAYGKGYSYNPDSVAERLVDLVKKLIDKGII